MNITTKHKKLATIIISGIIASCFVIKHVNNKQDTEPLAVNTALVDEVVCNNEQELKTWLKKELCITEAPSSIVIKNDRVEYVKNGPLTKRDLIIAEKTPIKDIRRGIKVPTILDFRNCNNEKVEFNGTYILEVFMKNCPDCIEYAASQDYEDLREYEVYPHYRVDLNATVKDIKHLKWTK